ncbi:MAG: ATP-dependent helicase RecQ [Solirubrobacteraceae bacterium]|nr:ATP-dependent helicase RecQ [Solirubrobacteraceae bacterium]
MDLDAALSEHFGFSAFRPGQRDACAATLAGRDVLAVMPTGAGKSLCYQLPALMRDELALVVSPLVSLMQDQVDALGALAPERVALVNAQQEPAVNRGALERAVAGDLRLLYVAPERFSSPGFVERLAQAKIGLFVVDEAHCVSQWGHDFRPDYFRLADAARYLGARSIFASTATATPQVAADIVRRLGLRAPTQITTGFDRPNLSFAVIPCRTKADKHRRLAAALREPDALPAIVYAGTRAGCDALAPELRDALGTEVIAYHAGLGREQRASAQRRFMHGEAQVVVATNAFGMGVDKADVRTVCHATVPPSVEAYYQEAGRAGRDGEPARCLLFAEQRDKGLHVFFIERAAIDESLFARTFAALELRAEGDRYDLGVGDLTALAGCDDEQARSLIGHLARAGVLQPAPSSTDRLRGRLLAPFDSRALAQCRTSAGDAQRSRWSQYRSVWAFVEGERCRRESVLRHFGDRSTPRPSVACCDVCEPSLAPAPIEASMPAAAEGELDTAIVELVAAARPAVGRTRAVEILRGGRSKVIQRHSYDGLPSYGTFSHLTNDEVLGRVDELLRGGALRSTGGRFPKLAAAPVTS